MRGNLSYLLFIFCIMNCGDEPQPIALLDLPQAQAQHGATTLRIAHITDPHVYDGKSKYMTLERENEGCLNLRLVDETVREINAQHRTEPITMVVVTGDIGVEKLIENAGINCKTTTMTTGVDGKTLFDGISKDAAIHGNFTAFAREFAHIIARSHVADWLFVNGNNDLCNENIKSVAYFNDYLAELAKAVTSINPKVTVRNLVADSDHVSVFSPPSHSKHVFIGFENGSWKNNHTAIYADSINKEFQYGVLRDLEMEVEKQERLGKHIHLVFHCPNFDDPWHAASAHEPCAKRLPTNATFENSCTNAKPKIATNRPENFYSAWLVHDDFRARFNAIMAKPSVKTLIAGHFHSQTRENYLSPKSYQTQNYPHLEKYNVAPPISIKNQTVSTHENQARGFTLLHFLADGTRESEFFWSNQVTNGACHEVIFSPWTTEKGH